MKVYTKTGDAGETSLFGGKRIKKSNLRIEAYGTVDELNSWIGLIRDQKINSDSVDELLEIQDRLFTLGALLASDPNKSLSNKVPQIIPSDIEFLEMKMDAMDSKLAPMKSFVLPGGHSTVSYCHLARCVCRRAERLVVALSEEEKTDNILISYLNRLSDYLFVLSRFLGLELNVIESPWKPRI